MEEAELEIQLRWDEVGPKFSPGIHANPFWESLLRRPSDFISSINHFKVLTPATSLNPVRLKQRVFFLSLYMLPDGLLYIYLFEEKGKKGVKQKRYKDRKRYQVIKSTPNSPPPQSSHIFLSPSQKENPQNRKIATINFSYPSPSLQQKPFQQPSPFPQLET